MGNALKGLLKILLWVLVPAALVFVGLRLTVLEERALDHAGMAPTLHPGDHLLIWRGAPMAGRVVACENVSAASPLAVGRVVAVGGQRVESARSQLMVNGHIPEMDWNAEETFAGGPGLPAVVMQRGRETVASMPHDVYLRKGAELLVRPHTVAAGRFFLLSDNRSYARRDSRSFGAVPGDRCLGTVVFRYRTAPPVDGGSWLSFVR